MTLTRGSFRRWSFRSLLAAFLLGLISPAISAAELQKVPMAVSWFAYQTKHMPYWIAKEKGYFAAEGLEVTINQNRGSEASIQALMSGQILFAEISPVTLLQTQAKGGGKVNVVMIGITEQKLTDGLGFLATSGIKTPKDFEGKTVGIVAQSLNNLLWPSFAKVTGIDNEKIKRVSVDWTNFRQLLITGRIDVSNWIEGQPEDMDAVLKGEPRVTGFPFGNYLPLIGSGWATTTDMIEKHPETVLAFTRAMQKAIKYEIDSPREAVTEAAQFQTKNLDKIPSEKGRIEAALQIVPAILVKETNKGKPVGWSDPADWQKMIDLLAPVDKWARTPTVQEAMTNKFVQ